ncbi:Potassium-transporting ATPase C chain [Granulibacter bethesdensis CGDNIH1]|uniref:Potassium-transporting ATPase KdpC subunit n=2 Tax=Granulibacter bethesdensis TaxID=364410 RepID=Q0BVS0_GRABC|nr:Potassium-transporting ATPase C chain [Granulibacter bethesdensis CGDNIH1]APH50857.1 Potassium-transporting ATPase C chain [Granulibacter bethesdensis]APH63551.1 Potassium-transporting ATPase C chain [Granulibacter bethesdensis]
MRAHVMIIMRHLRPAIMVFLFLSLITGILYPLAITGVSALVMPGKAGGSLVYDHGKLVGSRLIGQNFIQPGYFHPRLSATMGPDPANAAVTISAPYNAAASAASNLGPTSKALIDRVAASAAALKAENPEALAAGLPIPVDLVTGSGSGLDPDISPQAAMFQVKRIARVRKLPENLIVTLVNQMTEQPFLGWLGEPRVNVLQLNMALDTLK